jgi:hypothetical protein
MPNGFSRPRALPIDTAEPFGRMRIIRTIPARDTLFGAGNCSAEILRRDYTRLGRAADLGRSHGCIYDVGLLRQRGM